MMQDYFRTRKMSCIRERMTDAFFFMIIVMMMIARVFVVVMVAYLVVMMMMGHNAMNQRKRIRKET
jgi:hypothetical protein